jgi:hypothetical protein
MWQVEDLIRAYQFDIELIDKNLISQYSQSERIKNEIRDWYANLILMMHQEGIMEKGHLSYLKNLIDEISDLHIRLIKHAGETDYHQVYSNAAGYLDDFRKKTGNDGAGDIETCFNALYGLLLLRLKKQPVSRETELAMASFSKLLALLSYRFLRMERNE